MKKVLVASAAFLFAIITNANASTISKTETFVQDTTQKSKTPVKPEELPKAVKDVLAGDEYKGWAVASASGVKGTREYYEITLTKGAESKIANLDKEGKKVD